MDLAKETDDEIMRIASPITGNLMEGRDTRACTYAELGQRLARGTAR
jgi:hypothetical protein